MNLYTALEMFWVSLAQSCTLKPNAPHRGIVCRLNGEKENEVSCLGSSLETKVQGINEVKTFVN